MKANIWVVAIFSTLTIGLFGCGKTKLPETQQVEGQSIELPKLQQAFATSTNYDANKLISEAAYGLRYADYVKSLMALDKLSNQPDLTPDQKKIVSIVTDQVKKLAGGGAATAPAPAQ